MEKLDPKTPFFNTNSALSKYGQAVDSVGLWKSEKKLVKMFCPNINGSILDVGCGAGRTTFGLYRMGYKNVTGIDISEKLVSYAKDYATKNNIPIPIILGDAVQMPFGNGTFDFALFSYNGLTGIPTERRRLLIVNEIYRVLKKGAYFVFCAHDRDGCEQNRTFWLNEKKRWEANKENPSLYEYGDVIFSNDSGKTFEFLHYYSIDEMKRFISLSKFSYITHISRKDISVESKNVLDFSKETMFWILKRE